MTKTFPTSTYRLQITDQFTLWDAADICPYLAELGVDAVYCSPLLTSVAGSTHGYDWVDPTQVDPRRGGEDGWAGFVAAARQAGLKIVVDIVPNHMGIADPTQNRYWWSVLRAGEDSEYAHWFDIDFSVGPIRIPVLADEDAISDLTLSDDGTELHYYEHTYPVAPGTYEPGDSPVQVHERQHYRLIPWQRGDEELNYRRFFAVTDLAGLRVEDEDVFAATHERILRFVTEDHIEGLRVDHPDGLVDPQQYFERLRHAVGEDVWIIGEKILEPGERLPQSWPIQGTTGYDAMTEVDQVLIDSSAQEFFTAHFAEVTGDERTMTQHMTDGRLLAATEMFGAEIRRILAAIEPDQAPRDLETAKTVLADLASRFPVYRSYLPLGEDLVHQAAAQTRAQYPQYRSTVDALEQVLCDPGQEAARRFQQLTGAVMAKGVEDTAYYRYNRFVSLNEVGGDPGTFGYPVTRFHELQTERTSRLPASMTSLSTHDTKRSEDVRARMAVLSEIPQLWRNFYATFSQHTSIPQPRLSYLLAQVLVGVGMCDRQRLHDYADKAMREAKDGTSWTDPDPQFEQAVHDSIDACFDNLELYDAWDEILEEVKFAGRTNALVHKALQLTMPGIPDVYQGTELWDDSLVDPDNRRPVDYELRQELLSKVDSVNTANHSSAMNETGLAKLTVTTRLLKLRRQNPELFTTYRPVTARGEMADHVIAFDRGRATVVATRLPHSLASCGGWLSTEITLPYSGIDVLTGRFFEPEVTLEELMLDYPVAVIIQA